MEWLLAWLAFNVLVLVWRLTVTGALSERSAPA